MRKSVYLPLVASLLLSTSLSSAKAAGIPMAINDLDQGTLSMTTPSRQVNLGTVMVEGVQAHDLLGISVSGAGDVNDDGIDDVMVVGGYPPVVYVIYGQKGLSSGSIDLKNFNATVGFEIQCGCDVATASSAGAPVGGIRDVNGDGIDDMLIGSYFSQAYVIYGRKGGYGEPINLTNFNSTLGFEIQIPTPYAGCTIGIYVAGAGDVNGDDLADVMVSEICRDPQFDVNTYVIYGRSGGYPFPINLANFNYLEGFVIQQQGLPNGLDPISGVGDVNGDGLADMLVTNPNSSPSYAAGSIYVVYGKKNGYSGPIDLANFNSTVGFEIQGGAPYAEAGFFVGGAGDVNGDGINDIIGGVGGDTQYQTPYQYVVYGRQGGYPVSIDLANLIFEPSVGFIIQGTADNPIGGPCSGIGDVNGDGVDDVAISTIAHSSGNVQWTANAYVIYGCQGGCPSPIKIADLSAASGFGISEGSFSVNNTYFGSLSFNVGNAGDWNGDGRDDILLGFQYWYPNEQSPNVGAAYIISDLSSAYRSKKRN